MGEVMVGNKQPPTLRALTQWVQFSLLRGLTVDFRQLEKPLAGELLATLAKVKRVWLLVSRVLELPTRSDTHHFSQAKVSHMAISNLKGLGRYSATIRASQLALVVMNLPANAADARDMGLIPRIGTIPCKRKWQSTPGFLPGKSRGQRSLVG